MKGATKQGNEMRRVIVLPDSVSKHMSTNAAGSIATATRAYEHLMEIGAIATDKSLDELSSFKAFTAKCDELGIDGMLAYVADMKVLADFCKRTSEMLMDAAAIMHRETGYSPTPASVNAWGKKHMGVDLGEEE